MNGPRFHTYVVEQRRPSYRHKGDVRVGVELPEEGVTYYEVPREYGAREYRYTIINDRPVWLTPAAIASLKWSNKLKRSSPQGKAAPRAVFLKFPDAAEALNLSDQHPLQMLFIFAFTFGSSARISASPGIDGPGVTVPSIRPPFPA
jgi:hypothetical protein